MPGFLAIYTPSHSEMLIARAHVHLEGKPNSMTSISIYRSYDLFHVFHWTSQQRQWFTVNRFNVLLWLPSLKCLFGVEISVPILILSSSF
jgi:hypothetical protein